MTDADAAVGFWGVSSSVRMEAIVIAATCRPLVVYTTVASLQTVYDDQH